MQALHRGAEAAMIWVSPTEPMGIRTALDLAELEWETSGKPEPRGVDLLWYVGGRFYGVQRKTVDDFLASCNDGRLAREVGQMRASVTMPMIIMEGRVGDRWGQSIGQDELRKRELSLMAAGVHVIRTRDVSDTVLWLRVLYGWSQETEHSTAVNVPKAAMDWGKPTNADWQAAVLMQLPGVGARRARDIARVLGNPLRLTCTRGELMAVEGLGKVTVEKIWAAFGGADDEQET